jgi:hypothetical protein
MDDFVWLKRIEDKYFLKVSNVKYPRTFGLPKFMNHDNLIIINTNLEIVGKDDKGKENVTNCKLTVELEEFKVSLLIETMIKLLKTQGMNQARFKRLMMEKFTVVEDMTSSRTYFANYMIEIETQPSTIHIKVTKEDTLSHQSSITIPGMSILSEFTLKVTLEVYNCKPIVLYVKKERLDDILNALQSTLTHTCNSNTLTSYLNKCLGTLNEF